MAHISITFEYGIQYFGHPYRTDGYIETGGTTLGGANVAKYSMADADAIASNSEFGTLVVREVRIETKVSEWTDFPD